MSETTRPAPFDGPEFDGWECNAHYAFMGAFRIGADGSFVGEDTEGNEFDFDCHSLSHARALFDSMVVNVDRVDDRDMEDAE
jgi:hypothetical protein